MIENDQNVSAISFRAFWSWGDKYNSAGYCTLVLLQYISFFFYPLSFPRKMLLFTKMEMQGKTLHKLGFRVKKFFCKGEFDNILKDSV